MKHIDSYFDFSSPLMKMDLRRLKWAKDLALKDFRMAPATCACAVSAGIVTLPGNKVVQFFVKAVEVGTKKLKNGKTRVYYERPL